MPNWQEPFHIPLKKRHGTQQEANVTTLSKNNRPETRLIQTGPNTAGTKRAEQPPGLSCVARFERSAGVFADRAAS